MATPYLAETLRTRCMRRGLLSRDRKLHCAHAVSAITQVAVNK